MEEVEAMPTARPPDNGRGTVHAVLRERHQAYRADVTTRTRVLQ